MSAADKMKAEALAVFGGLEYPELARDVIEWFHASILVQQEQAQFIQECYGDCVTGSPKTCPNPCGYQGRPRP